MKTKKTQTKTNKVFKSNKQMEIMTNLSVIPVHLCILDLLRQINVQIISKANVVIWNRIHLDTQDIYRDLVTISTMAA